MIKVDQQAFQGLNMKYEPKKFLQCNLRDMGGKAVKFMQLGLRIQEQPHMGMIIFTKMENSNSN